MVGMPVCEAFLRSQTFEAWTEALVESLGQKDRSSTERTTQMKTRQDQRADIITIKSYTAAMRSFYSLLIYRKPCLAAG